MMVAGACQVPAPSDPPMKEASHLDYSINSFNGDARVPESFRTFDLKAFWSLPIWLLFYHMIDKQYFLCYFDAKQASELETAFLLHDSDSSGIMNSATFARLVNK